jgi:hypothetical protein
MNWMGMLGVVVAASTGLQPGGDTLPVICFGHCPVDAVAESEPIVRQGDWTIVGKQAYRDKHIRLDGTLVLPQGTELILERCTLEIAGDYSREHSVEWKGGSLVTRNCTIGGFVDPSGTAIHTVFHLYDGNWDATDTIVQYSYGISFHWNKGHGVLRGTRLIAGPRPDAIILSGEADVKLVDSDFPIGLGLYVDQGGATTLDLVPDKPITATYDQKNLLPGVNWKLEMQNTSVKRWFVFVRNIGMRHEPAEITLKNSRDVIVSLLGHNLTGQINLSNDLLEPMSVGNVLLKRVGGPAGISMYAIYLSGDKNDVFITGKSHICELMHRGGRLRITGDPGENQISIGCTTLELSGDAEMEIHHVHMGRPLTWQAEKSVGEATIADNALLTGSDVSVRNVRFRTTDDGRVELTGVQQHGELEEREEGGKIVIERRQKPGK